MNIVWSGVIHENSVFQAINHHSNYIFDWISDVPIGIKATNINLVARHLFIIVFASEATLNQLHDSSALILH
jgi:hypothetical protein